MSTREQSRRFHFLREIASGGFGSVYLTKVMHSDGFSRLVAVKLLHRRWSENEEIARRMRDEARLLGWLRHRNIVDVFDLTSIDGRAAVVMEYLEAIDLKQIIQHAAESGGSVPARPALEVMARVASALDAAYNRPPYPGEKPLRVIHRDIKPSNIMVDEAGVVKVLDFGVARADFDSRESHTRELQFGSVDYMPPERLFFEPETPASDVYSLAATIYEFLVLEKLGKARGRPQKHERFLADRLSYLRAASTAGPVSSAVEQLLGECLAYEHAERPPAADVAKRALALARKIDGPDLREWCEEIVPPLLQESQARELPPNPLTDTVLPEDRVSLEDAGPVAAKAAPAAGPVEEEEPEVPRSDPRWEALRQAALDELRPPTIPNPATAPPMPVTPRAAPPPPRAEPPPSAARAEPPPAAARRAASAARRASASAARGAAAPPRPAPPPPPAAGLPSPQPSIDGPAFGAQPPTGPAPFPAVASPVSSALEPFGEVDPADANAPSLPYHLKKRALERGLDLGNTGGPDPDAATRIGPALPPPEPAAHLERPPAPSMHMDLEELFGGSPPPPPPSVGVAPLPPADDDTPVIDEAPAPDSGEDFVDDLDGFDAFADDVAADDYGADAFGGWDTGAGDFEDDIDPELMATRIEPMGDKLDEVLSKISAEDRGPPDPDPDYSAPSLDDWGDIPTRLDVNPLAKPDATPQIEGTINEAATLIRPQDAAPPPVAQAMQGPPQPREVWPPPPPPEPPEEPAPPPRQKKKKAKKKSSGLLLTVGVATLAVLTGACLGGVLIFGDELRGALGLGDKPVAAADPEVTPDEPPDEAAGGGEDEASAAPAGPSMHFVSLAPETRKLNVSCSGVERASGTSDLYVAAASAEKCVVTAILKRGRHTATVTDASEGEYKCFEGGENKCER
ncbi:MAG: serine/threonine protein kinase [Alphaproteobacteria bacterium]|nr:serine/threonine protein kinase [Alphaproteobacteria bacterium]